MNGFCSYKDLYIASHDGAVDLIAREVRQVVSPTAHMHKHCCVTGSWFDVDDDDVISCGPNTPDIVVVGEAFILEVGCSVGGYMEQTFAEKLFKYQPLMACWDSLGWRCKLVELIFVSTQACSVLCTDYYKPFLVSELVVLGDLHLDWLSHASV